MHYGIAQHHNPLDSLNQALKHAENDSARVRILIEIADLYEFRDPQQVLSHLESALSVTERNFDKGSIFQTLHVDASQRIGIAYINQSATDKALEHLMNALRISEEIGYSFGQASALNGIGMVHDDLQDYQLAISYYRQSLRISKETGNRIGVARASNNIGVAYGRIREYKQAIEYYKEAAKVFEDIGNQYFYAATMNNIGTYYLAQLEQIKQPDSLIECCMGALNYFKKAATIYEELERDFHLTTCLSNIALAHQKIFTILPTDHPQKQEHYHEAIRYGESALELSQQIKDFHSIGYAAKALMGTFRNQSECDRALAMADIIIANKDSLFSNERLKISAEIEATYQLDKQNQELEKQRLVSSRQQLLNRALLVVVFLMVFLAGALYYGYSNKRKSNRIIKEQNTILEQANSEILSQRDELQSQRDTVVGQNTRLEEMHNHITHSLQYAQSIQAAILPSEKILESISSDYFVLLKPCEVVSGDFFWTTTFDDFEIFCVADCTGHGVPGAFMSILGVTALNDIVGRYKISKPNEILDYLRRSVIEALSQNNPEQLHKDGMDIAMCVFNKKTRKLHFSGAGLPLWIIPENQSQRLIISGEVKMYTHNNIALYEIKPDNMPVGLSPTCDSFSSVTLDLSNTPTSIYLLTDGYLDQFGGPMHSKFGSIRLKKQIIENCHLPFPKQKTIMEQGFKKWLGSNYQIDDIAILGIKL